VSPQGTYFCSLSTWLYHFLFVSRLRSYTFKIPRREDKTLIIQLVTDFFLYHFQNTSTCVYMTLKCTYNGRGGGGGGGGGGSGGSGSGGSATERDWRQLGDGAATAAYRR
jgi:uncharacterized membrane protein YgcG